MERLRHVSMFTPPPAGNSKLIVNEDKNLSVDLCSNAGRCKHFQALSQDRTDNGRRCPLMMCGEVEINGVAVPLITCPRIEGTVLFRREENTDTPPEACFSSDKTTAIRELKMSGHTAY